MIVWDETTHPNLPAVPTFLAFLMIPFEVLRIRAAQKKNN